jgi:hypothetical protein
VRGIFLTGIAAVCGLAWGVDDWLALAGLAALIPLLWYRARSRWSASAVALAYYLAVSRGIPFGAGVFFAETAPGWFSWALWAVAGLVNASPWVICWSQRPRQRLLGLPVALVLGAVPPIGLIGWTHPITTAGVLFPGLGFIGIGLLLGLWLAISNNRPRWAAGLVIVAAAVNVVALGSEEGMTPKGWAGIDTQFGRYRVAPGVDDFMEAFGRLRAVQAAARDLSPGSVAVMPETILGLYTEVTAAELVDTAERLRGQGSTVLVGAGRAIGSGFENGLVVVGDGEPQWIRQRIPVPIGMWRPWAPDSVAADPWGNGVAIVAGVRVAVLICYEELLIWPVLLSMAHGPEAIVGAANDWWARDTSIPAIQRQSLALWGRLFAKPVITAVNL